MVKHMEKIMPEISNLRDICKLLEPYRDVTNMISADRYPTLSMVLPLYHSLLARSAVSNDSDSGMVSSMKSILHSDLSARYV